MTDETMRKLDELTDKTGRLETDVALVKQRIDAQEARTERMMQESAAGRAEIHRDFETVSKKIQKVHDYQVSQQGKEDAERASGTGWPERIYKASIPAMLTIILIAIALKDMDLI